LGAFRAENVTMWLETNQAIAIFGALSQLA